MLRNRELQTSQARKARRLPDQEVPVHAKTDKIPYLTQWSTHRYILLRALWPIVLQYAYISITGWRLHPVAAFLLYTVAMQLNSIREVKILRRLAHRYGFLDGEKPRDEVPDVAVRFRAGMFCGIYC